MDVLRRICKYESEMLKHAHDPTIRDFFAKELEKLDVELMKYTKAIRSCCTGVSFSFIVVVWSSFVLSFSSDIVSPMLFSTPMNLYTSIIISV